MVNITAYERELARLAWVYEMSVQRVVETIEAARVERTTTREARIEEIERRRDSVLAECNPDLPTYDPR